MTEGELERSTRLRPEEEELARLEARLADLEDELADRELELATRRRELRDFEQRFLAIVGTRQAELDRLEAQIAALLAVRDPSPETQQAAEASAEQARRSSEELGDDPEALAEAAAAPPREIPEDLKKLFRRVAKAVHPDYAVDDEDRATRERAMADANAAYELGDVARLTAVLEEWESRPEAVSGSDTGSKIVRTIRRIAAAEQRLAELAAEIVALNGSSLAVLQAKVQEAQAEGRDLLQEMAVGLDLRIEATRRKLDDLRDGDLGARGQDQTAPEAQDIESTAPQPSCREAPMRSELLESIANHLQFLGYETEWMPLGQDGSEMAIGRHSTRVDWIVMEVLGVAYLHLTFSRRSSCRQTRAQVLEVVNGLNDGPTPAKWYLDSDDEIGLWALVASYDRVSFGRLLDLLDTSLQISMQDEAFASIVGRD